MILRIDEILNINSLYKNRLLCIEYPSTNAKNVIVDIVNDETAYAILCATHICQQMQK